MHNNKLKKGTFNSYDISAIVPDTGIKIFGGGVHFTKAKLSPETEWSSQIM